MSDGWYFMAAAVFVAVNALWIIGVIEGYYNRVARPEVGWREAAHG